MSRLDENANRLHRIMSTHMWSPGSDFEWLIWEVERLREFEGDAIRAITAYTEACTALTVENTALRQHLKRVRKAIGGISGGRAQDEAALDSLSLDLDEYLDAAAAGVVVSEREPT